MDRYTTDHSNKRYCEDTCVTRCNTLRDIIMFGTRCRAIIKRPIPFNPCISNIYLLVLSVKAIDRANKIECRRIRHRLLAEIDDNTDARLYRMM